MENKPYKIRVMCPKLLLTYPTNSSTSLQWLITSPFFPFTLISTVRCLHFRPSDHFMPDYLKESDDLRSLIIRGFHVTGALIISLNDVVLEEVAKRAIAATRKLREVLYGDNVGGVELVGGVKSKSGSGLRFFASGAEEGAAVEEVEEVVYDEMAAGYLWERGCLIRCGVHLQVPVYVNPTKRQEAVGRYLNAHDALAKMFEDTQLTYILEASERSSDNLPRPVVIQGSELDFETEIVNVKILADTTKQSSRKSLCCSYFCTEGKQLSRFGAESADTIQVTAFFNRSGKFQGSNAPVAEYYPASEESSLMVVDYKLEVVCYAVKDLPLTYAISKLIIPALVDQMTTMKNIISPSLFGQNPQLHPYHFCPPGLLHPVTAVYELSYGETETKQVEARRSLHLRLGLPSDRPLLRTANALNLAKSSDNGKVAVKKGYLLLKDVHSSIPSSGVSGGLVSVVQGSYEYHHYLQGGFDDSGWGCAYRSLQTIISWFRLQHYTSIDVPTHREIQEALVEIGDKDASFIGSREWIGAIELSYVLDKLLGVTCKVMNVRSGDELPEKCRELALHFENQGTPVMIGGGVLAYTLLGVDYNDASGDCAFLILDPHYTGGEDLKKIVNGGWCGWKKAVDGKGKSFFLADKFYNLLLPQRPNMV